MCKEKKKKGYRIDKWQLKEKPQNSMEKVKTSDITELSEIRPMPKDQKEEEEVTPVAEMKSQKKANR